MFQAYVPLFVILIMVSVSDNAPTEETKKKFIEKVLLCAKGNPKVDLRELVKLQQHRIPTSKHTKCVLACAYRAEGYMTADGMYDLDNVVRRAPHVGNGDRKREQNFVKLANICQKVNDEKVSDGNDGCDRAALMFKCTVDNASKYGFDI